MTVSLEQSLAIAATTLAAGRRRALQPLTVAVLDPGGHLVVLERDDGSGILRPQIAVGKAWGALGMGFGTRELAARAGTAPSFVAALSAVSDGRIVPVPGGVLIRSSPDGPVIGAVGVTGDTSDNDEACAVEGVQAAGLTPDGG